MQQPRIFLNTRAGEIKQIAFLCIFFSENCILNLNLIKKLYVERSAMMRMFLRTHKHHLKFSFSAAAIYGP
jgi:hypothetical protein